MITARRIHEVYAEESNGRGPTFVLDALQRTVFRLLREATPEDHIGACAREAHEERQRRHATENELEQMAEANRGLRAEVQSLRATVVQVRAEMRRMNNEPPRLRDALLAKVIR